MELKYPLHSASKVCFLGQHHPEEGALFFLSNTNVTDPLQPQGSLLCWAKVPLSLLPHPEILSASPHCSSHLVPKVLAHLYKRRGECPHTEISLSWATSSATCPRAWRSSWDSRASLSFILFSVRIISSFSNVFVSHSRSFLSSLLTSSMCSGMGWDRKGNEERE